MLDLEKIYDRGAFFDKDLTYNLKLKASELKRIEDFVIRSNLGSMNTFLRGLILSFLDEYEQLQQDIADLPDQEASK